MTGERIWARDGSCVGRRSENGRRRLTRADFLAIIRRRRAGEHPRALAVEHGVVRSRIDQIVAEAYLYPEVDR